MNKVDWQEIRLIDKNNWQRKLTDEWLSHSWFGVRQTDGRTTRAKMMSFKWIHYLNICRCFLFPYRVLYSTLHAAEIYIDMFPAYYIFNSLLIILQVLNVMWTVMILRVILDNFNIILIKLSFCRLHSLPWCKVVLKIVEAIQKIVFLMVMTRKRANRA